MPLRFIADCTEAFTAEKVDEEDFRYIIGAVAVKMRHTVFTAPLVDGNSAITGKLNNFAGGQYIWIIHKQRCIVAMEFSKSFGGELFWHTGAFASLCPVPAGSGGIIFGMVTALPEVLLHILFSDGITACLFPGIMARHGSALQQISCCGFADMADAIELVFTDSVGDLVPVNPFIHSLTPQGNYFGCLRCSLRRFLSEFLTLVLCCRFYPFSLLRAKFLSQKRKNEKISIGSNIGLTASLLRQKACGGAGFGHYRPHWKSLV